MIRIITVLCLAVMFKGASAQDVMPPEIERAHPFPVSSVWLLPSNVKQHEDMNVKYLKSLDADRLLHNFRVNAGLPSAAVPLNGWEAPEIGLRGHFVGHYLSAVSHLAGRYGDAELQGRLTYIVDELQKCQQQFGNGYLSAFPEKDFDVLESGADRVWAPYYTYDKIMRGLLDAYLYGGNTKAYEMVVDMAGYVEKRMQRLDAQTIERVLYCVGANPMNEPGAMNEVLHRLYKVSKDERHLRLAKLFDRDWFAVPLSKGEDILSGLHANTHIALVNGFSERYPSTREQCYRDACMNFWEMLMHGHAYANGSSSGPRPNVTTGVSLKAEHWGVPGILSNTLTGEIAETCVSHNTQKLTSQLFCWTADPRYADAYMNTFYNAVLASHSVHSGACVYHLPLGSPRRKHFLKEDDFRCCNGSTVEAFSALNKNIYFYSGDTLWTNLYIPSELHWEEKGIVLKQSGDFPRKSSVEFTVNSAHKRVLTFRMFIPSWAEKVQVMINGEKQDIATGSCSYVELTRRWKNNDKVQLVFDYDFHLRTMPDNPQVIALFHGPSMLAFVDSRELIMKGSHHEILSGLTAEGGGKYTLENGGRTYRLIPLYDVEEQDYGVYATIRNY